MITCKFAYKMSFCVVSRYTDACCLLFQFFVYYLIFVCLFFRWHQKKIKIFTSNYQSEFVLPIKIYFCSIDWGIDPDLELELELNDLELDLELELKLDYLEQDLELDPKLDYLELDLDPIFFLWNRKMFQISISLIFF